MPAYVQRWYYMTDRFIDFMLKILYFLFDKLKKLNVKIYVIIFV